MSENIGNELINEELNNIGRASDLLWLHFGQKFYIINRRGIEVEKGSYGIHIQCPWRFIHQGILVLGSMDIYMPKEGVHESDFNWDEIGNSVFDEKIKVIKEKILPIKVQKVESDEIGNLKLIFEDDFVFEAMPNCSVKQEFWRLINNVTKEHTVIFE